MNVSLSIVWMIFLTISHQTECLRDEKREGSQKTGMLTNTSGNKKHPELIMIDKKKRAQRDDKVSFVRPATIVKAVSLDDHVNIKTVEQNEKGTESELKQTKIHFKDCTCGMTLRQFETEELLTSIHSRNAEARWIKATAHMSKRTKGNGSYRFISRRFHTRKDQFTRKFQSRLTHRIYMFYSRRRHSRKGRFTRKYLSKKRRIGFTRKHYKLKTLRTRSLARRTNSTRRFSGTQRTRRTNKLVSRGKIKIRMCKTKKRSTGYTKKRPSKNSGYTKKSYNSRRLRRTGLGSFVTRQKRGHKFKRTNTGYTKKSRNGRRLRRTRLGTFVTPQKRTHKFKRTNVGYTRKRRTRRRLRTRLVSFATRRKRTNRFKRTKNMQKGKGNEVHLKYHNNIKPNAEQNTLLAASYEQENDKSHHKYVKRKLLNASSKQENSNSIDINSHSLMQSKTNSVFKKISITRRRKNTRARWTNNPRTCVKYLGKTLLCYIKTNRFAKRRSRSMSSYISRGSYTKRRRTAIARALNGQRRTRLFPITGWTKGPYKKLSTGYTLRKHSRRKDRFYPFKSRRRYTLRCRRRLNKSSKDCKSQQTKSNKRHLPANAKKYSRRQKTLHAYTSFWTI